MAQRIGAHTVRLERPPAVAAHAGLAGKKEREGPLGACFDKTFEDARFGKKTWEQAEQTLLQNALTLAAGKLPRTCPQPEAIFAGDLQNQCTASSFAFKESGLPFCGLYGACSTMALTLAMAALSVEAGAFRAAAAVTGSHFCTAERQFRKPLEYGGQRAPTAQWTVTGAGAAILAANGGPGDPRITHLHFGTITDLGVTDGANMGAAMAPAAARTIADLLRDTDTTPRDYDLILTGDLGFVGGALLRELLRREEFDLTETHNDCGMMIYDREKQDVHAGGSGCGCSASVLCSHIFDEMRRGRYRRILFAATGALLSATSALQGASIPGIAHAVVIESGERMTDR
ncbi:MAG: stage V sporulation protein AD [Clostridia bacterium]|nr:stage V sporulation protein AD [Clostridia bacterium]